MIRNIEDTIYVTDIIERIDDLEDDRFKTRGEVEELEELKDLVEQVRSYEGWEDGILIHEDYFVNYAREYAMDTCFINDPYSWPYNCIDWEAVADQLQNDYSIITFDGVDYYIRIN